MASDPHFPAGLTARSRETARDAAGAEPRGTKKYETSDALRRAEGQLAAISSTFNGLLVQVSRDGVVQHVGGHIAQEYRGQWEGRSVFDILPEQPAARLRPILGRVIESGQLERLRYISERADKLYEGQMGPLRDGEQIVGAVALLMDVTRRARAEEALRESEESYRTVAENMTDVVVVCDLEARILFASANAGEILAVPEAAGSWMGRSILEAVHPDDRERVMAEFAEGRVTRGRRRVTWRSLPRDGEVRWFETHGQFMTLPMGERAVLVNRDVSAQKQIEDELREKRTFYQLISEIHSDIHFSFEVGVDRQLRISWDARSIEQLAGDGEREYQDLADWDWRRLAHPEDHERAKAWVNETLAGRQKDPIEWRLVRSNGEVRWMRSWVVQVPGTQPGAIRGIGSTTDITESKRLEEDRARYQERLQSEVEERTLELEQANAALRQLQDRLMHAERIRASEHLAGAIAHSINNPLTALIGTVQMHIEQSGKADPQSDRVLQLARRIRLVVDRTLQLFRAGSLQLTRHAPGEILNAVCGELSDRIQRTGIELKLSVERGLPRLTVDHALLSMALLSICENAIDAMPDGGVLSLEAFRLAGVGVLVLRIDDTGPGIPAELREEVLRPFFTTKGGGTGLGLAIARGVVEGHEGRMSIESAPSGGTRIRLELPLPE
jgi:PAS domain S-box-containing protein